MANINQLLENEGLARKLIDSLPAGVLILDGTGRVRAVNNVIKRVFNVSENVVIGKGPGDALNCLYAPDHKEGCGAGECCQLCEARNLAVEALSANRIQKGLAHLQLVIQGQIRDVSLLISAVPVILDHQKRIAVITIENITGLKHITPPQGGEGFRGIIGRGRKFLALIETIKDVAQTHAPVLIQGESGTGKELVALAIHRESSRARKHFVPVNCGALPEGVLESELFGHVKGAFTGSVRNRKGRFELADGGTLFFDEVCELYPKIQVKLLRVLQDGFFERLGSEETIHANVRIISASNKILEEEVAKERFREDLYYRLCVVPITVPALRERPGDISLLAKHYLSLYSKEALHGSMRLSPEALSLMTAYPWPGNVRELQNALQFALVRCHGTSIKPKHLPPVLGWGKFTPITARRRERKLKAEDVYETLKATGGNKKKAAQILGVARSTLYRFLGSEKKAHQEC